MAGDPEQPSHGTGEHKAPDGGRRPPAKTFQDLFVWQRAHQLVLGVYRLVEVFPKYELFGLCSQIRRSAVSVPSNIAEGFRKQGTADKARYVNMAQGSLEETRYYLILAQDLGYAQTGELMDALVEVSILLDRYHKAILSPRKRTDS